MADLSAYPADRTFTNKVDVHIVTDGSHHVLNMLASYYKDTFETFSYEPPDSRKLGFEVHHHLSKYIKHDYDLYCYFEDDLIIADPFFFQKILWFHQQVGADALLLPQRYEYASQPHPVEKFFIDGPLASSDLETVSLKKSQVVVAPYLSSEIIFEVPLNPHAGCFFLTRAQLEFWTHQEWWLDRDCRFIGPLESSATLGIAKTFKIYKPSFANASWLEICHWGSGFHSLLEV